MENCKERIDYIDVARGLAISLVVLGHTLTAGSIRQMIYEFHMPLFFVISGMILNEKQDSCPIKMIVLKIKRRAISYLVPYVIWGLFYSTLNLTNLMKLLYGTREALVEINSLTSLWFLPVLFLACSFSELLLWTLRKMKNQNYAILTLCIMLLFIGFRLSHTSDYGWPLGFDIAVVATAFMLMGFLMKRPIVCLSKNQGICAVLFVGSVLVFLLLNRKYPIQVHMYWNRYENIFLFLIYVMLGTMAVFSIAIIINLLFPLNKIMAYVGQNSLGILVIHKPIVRWGAALASKWVDNNNLAIALCIAIVGGFISIIVTAIIIKIVPVLIGKSA